MSGKAEKIIKAVFEKWQSLNTGSAGAHPDEEALACFAEGKLAYDESERVKVHLALCQPCSQKTAVQAKLPDAGLEITAPAELLVQAKALVKFDSSGLLEIIFKLKENILELLNTTGDVLVGQELMPAPILRSRAIKDFKDEVNIFKDFKDARVEVKLENKAGKSFNLIICVREKNTQKIIPDLRITLLKDDLELESYHIDSGKAVFENVLLGKYSVEITNLQEKLAVVVVDIRM